jgi:hypothetical protein
MQKKRRWFMLYENDGTYVLNNAASGTTHLYAVTLDVVDAYLAQVEREDDLAPKVIHMGEYIL